MPPKIRELIADLERAGFENRGGKGSHRKYVRAGVRKSVIVSGSLGADAKRYQIQQVREAIDEAKSKS